MSIFTNDRRAPTAAALPAAGTWVIDPAHTVIGFWARHLGVAKVRGEFRRFSGTAVIDEDPERSSVSVSIDASSIDTREPSRDEHLRSADFLDAANHPTLSFTSTRIGRRGDQWRVEGELTIRGVTRPVALDVDFGAVVNDEDGTTKAVLSARGEFDRTDFGLTWNQLLEAGRFLVGDRVVVELEVQLTPAA